MQETQTPSTDLDQLDALAAQVDADTSGTMPDGTLVADQPQPVNYAHEAAAAVDTFGALVVGYCPTAGELWSESKKTQVAAALAPVMEKYGFTLGALPCEIVLLVTAGPLLYQTSKLVAAQMGKDKAKKEDKKEPSQAPAAVMPVETPEVLQHKQMALYK